MNFYELLQREGVTVERHAGEHVFMQGDADTSLYCVQSGFLKAYYSSKAGKESIKSFLMPNDVIGSLAAIHSKAPCSFSLLCLQPSVLTKLTFESVYQYCQTDLELANELLEFTLDLAVKKEVREYEFLCMSAQERFCKLKKENSLLLEKATQNDLARYLGVTPVGLSRIKKRTDSR